MASNNFNLLRELYLNEYNNNILTDVISYLKRDTRYKIMKSFTDNDLGMCNNCFRTGTILTNQEQCELYFAYVKDEHCCFCKECSTIHWNTFTSLSSYRIQTCLNQDSIDLKFIHLCDIEKGREIVRYIGPNNYTLFLAKLAENKLLHGVPFDNFYFRY